MAPDNLEPSKINWHVAFPFTHLFRSFRMAIHPSKLALALGAVLVCYFAGRFLDVIAGKRVVVERPVYDLRMPADEIQQFIYTADSNQFYQWRDQAIQRRRQATIDQIRGLLNKNTKQANKIVDEGKALEQLSKKHQRELGDAQSTLEDHYGKAIAAAKDDQAKISQIDRANYYLQVAMLRGTTAADRLGHLEIDDAVNAVVLPDPAAEKKDVDRKEVAKDRQKVIRTVQLADGVQQVQGLEGVGIFGAALSYGILMFNQAVESVLALKFFFNDDFQGFSTTNSAPPGLVSTLGLAIMGLAWFAKVHWLYFIIYGLICMAVWAIAGGAICRIAALHATRDEKIPLTESVSFAIKKGISFFAAPLMPIVFIAACCVPLFLYGFVAAIPIVGELIAGLGFGLVLLIAFVQALLIVGGLAGLGLLYPTIAVEGSDTFDAFSRSYSYVFGRPWRTVFYTLVAAIYGTLCFVFVKLLVGLVFLLTHRVVGFGMNLDTASQAGGLGKLEAMWSSPSFAGPFFGRFFAFPLNWSESIGTFCTAIWVFMLVGLVIGFAISFFFTANTLIYLLLRRVVDATELDEVYVEEFEQPGEAEPAAVPVQEAPPAAAEQQQQEQEQKPAEDEQQAEEQQEDKPGPQGQDDTPAGT